MIFCVPRLLMHVMLPACRQESAVLGAGVHCVPVGSIDHVVGCVADSLFFCSSVMRTLLLPLHGVPADSFSVMMKNLLVSAHARINICLKFNLNLGC